MSLPFGVGPFSAYLLTHQVENCITFFFSHVYVIIWTTLGWMYSDPSCLQDALEVDSPVWWGLAWKIAADRILPGFCTRFWCINTLQDTSLSFFLNFPSCLAIIPWGCTFLSSHREWCLDCLRKQAPNFSTNLESVLQMELGQSFSVKMSGCHLVLWVQEVELKVSGNSHRGESRT